MRLVAAIAVALACCLPAGAATPLEQQGKSLYGRYCVACHGANGDGVAPSGSNRMGAGPMRMQYQQRGVAPPLHGVGAMAPDFYLRTGYMPLPRTGVQPRRTRVLLTDAQIRALIAYVSSLGPGPATPKPKPSQGNVAAGMHSFADHCAGCHQIAAEGGYVSGAVPPALTDATATQIAEAVRIGPYVMPRFSPKAIPDAELNSIVAYVLYTQHPDDSGGWPIGRIGPVPEGLVTWLIAAVALVAVCIVIGKRLSGEEA